MTSRTTRAALALGAIAGAASWVTAGCLDAVVGADGRVMRVALLPSVTILAVAVAVATTACLAAVRWLARRTRPTDPAQDAAAIDAIRPIGALGFLLLPYLPWLADALPVLTVLAGPGRWLVWFVVLVQVVRTAVPIAYPSRFTGSFGSRTPLLISLFVAGAIAGGIAAARFAPGPITPGGDEPHYLIIAQSLWRDGDLKIENNHDQGEYREYFDVGRLDPHFVTRGVDREIYSIHPIGLPLLLAPVYALGGYLAVLVALVGLSAVGGVIVAAWMMALGLPTSAIVFGWCATFLGAPFLLHSFTVYPEVPAGVTVLVAFWLMRRYDDEARARSPEHGAWLGVGMAAAWLPWLSTKYAPMAAALVAIALARLWITSTPIPARARRLMTAAVLAPFIASLAAWFSFFYVYWGSPLPSAPYGLTSDTTPATLVVGAPGLLFDQEYGILPYAPVLVLGFTGLSAMYRDGGEARRLALELAAIFGALGATVGAFHIWWGGVSPGRPVAAALLLLAVPIAWQFARHRGRGVGTALHATVLALTIGLTGLLLAAEQGFLTVNYRDGSATFLEYLSPNWNLASAVPSFIGQPASTAYLTSAVWIAILATAAWMARRLGRTPWSHARPGAASLWATGLCLAALIAGTQLAPLARDTVLSRRAHLVARGRAGLLDRFDVSRLPVAVRYDPLRLAAPDRLPPLTRFEISPSSAVASGGERELLYGRRLSLPAGRYRLGMSGVQVRETPETSGRWSVGLQVGRRLAPFMTWELGHSDATNWSPVVDLAVDANYVGLKVSPALEAARPSFWIEPLTVVDRSERLDTPTVQSAARIGDTSFYFFDQDAWIESTGFWIRGGSTTRFLAARERAASTPSGRDASLMDLRVRCGPGPNALQIVAAGQSTTLDLAPEERRSLQLMADGHHVVMALTPRDAWAPADHDPDSRDQRRLGCWVEIGGWLP